EHQHAIAGHGIERLAELADHSIPRGTECIAAQSVDLVRFDERGKLQQPGWRSLCQRLHEMPIRRANQLLERHEPPLIGFLAAEALHRVAARDPEIAYRTHVLNKPIDERGLPDTRLAFNEHDLTFSA